jgi:hypothetical protein
MVNVQFIGWTNIVFGICASIMSIILGTCTKYVAQSPFIVLMLMASICNGIFMLTVTPDPPHNTNVIFFIAVLFAISISYSNGQVRGFTHTHTSN